MDKRRRDFKPKVLVFWGESGCGKSYDADHYTENTYPVPKPTAEGGTLWFNGYDNSKHDTIIFHEFNGWISFTEFKLICDSYPHLV